MKKALLVGINNYPTAPLKGCINDAAGLATILETHGDGAPNFDVRLETDVKTKSALKTMISELFAGDSDTVILFFSGHGFVNELGGYLVTPDHQEYDEGISMDEILTFANRSKVKNKIIILDCCHSGAFGGATEGNGAIKINEGITILTASKSDEVSLEVGGRGVFTSLLIDALQGGAADLRGHVSPGGVYAYIDQALGAWQQRPVFKTNVTRFTSLREVTPQVPIATLRKITQLFPSPSNEYPLDPSFEDTNAEDIDHAVVQPYAKKENVDIFKDLQKLQSIGLVVPVGADYMYFAAMDSKSCRLTSLGSHYWRLVKDRRI